MENVGQFVVLVGGGLLVLLGAALIIFTAKYGTDFTAALYVEIRAVVAKLFQLLPGV